MITGNLLLNGSVQKGHKRRFGLKIQISLDLFSSGLLTDYHARNKGLQLFCDLKAWIWKISVSGLISDEWKKIESQTKDINQVSVSFVFDNSYDSQTWGISCTIDCFHFETVFHPLPPPTHFSYYIQIELVHYTSLWNSFFFVCKTPWVPLSHTRAHGRLFPFWFH